MIGVQGRCMTKGNSRGVKDPVGVVEKDGTVDVSCMIRMKSQTGALIIACLSQRVSLAILRWQESLKNMVPNNRLYHSSHELPTP
jgi:hypothetical protein